ncbi:putative L-lactate dehydrogenase operon regulatory protein [Clostridiales bacterium]|nr:putative L-lactate dehydrogenase operon regulatory protein [Clostridiales bacterium]
MNRKKSLVQQTADNIYTMVIDDEIFKPGEQLPNENILSEQLGVSRATLREAIRILASQGILDVYRGRGTFVNNEISSYSDIELKSMERIRVRLKDLYETRLICEPQITAIACRRATDRELDNILKTGSIVEKAILAGNDRTEIDKEFHKAIVKASHNEFLQRLLPVINNAVKGAITMNEGCRLPSEDMLARDTLRDHALIMEFMSRRDESGAKHAMSVHLHHAITNLRLNTDDEPIF